MNEIDNIMSHVTGDLRSLNESIGQLNYQLSLQNICYLTELAKANGFDSVTEAIGYAAEAKNVSQGQETPTIEALPQDVREFLENIVSKATLKDVSMTNVYAAEIYLNALSLLVRYRQVDKNAPQDQQTPSTPIPAVPDAYYGGSIIVRDESGNEIGRRGPAY
jgi:hypothetical protein